MSLSLEPGPHLVSLSARDLAGNVSPPLELRVDVLPARDTPLPPGGCVVRRTDSQPDGIAGYLLLAAWICTRRAIRRECPGKISPA